MQRISASRRSSRSFTGYVLAAAAGSVSLMMLPTAQAATETEDFTIAPGDWVGLNNGGPDSIYGHSATANTSYSTAGAGEAGGLFVRSNLKGYYADTTIGTLDQDDYIHGSGEFFFTDGATGDTDGAFGHLNTGTLAGNFNILGIGIFEGNPNPASHFRFTYQIYDDLGSDHHGARLEFPNGAYKYTYDWDPVTDNLNVKLINSSGVTVLSENSLDFSPSTLGKTFSVNAHGFSSGLNGSTNIGANYKYFTDALTYTVEGGAVSRTQNFTTEPTNWFKQGVQHFSSYGWSNTNNTGQASGAGEAGGSINRENLRDGYGDTTVGRLTDQNSFSAAGEFFMGNPQNPDSELFLGHYAQDMVDGVFEGDTNAGGRNLAGIHILDFGSSFRMQARVYTSDGTRLTSADPIVVPSAGQYKFDYAYDASTRTLTARILQTDGVTVVATQSVTLSGTDALTLDAFGMNEGFTGTPGSPPQSIDLFVDGLSYTINPGSTWAENSGDNWAAGTWVNGAPNATGAVANFGSAITANTTITVDSSEIVGTINFDDNNSYTISGPGQITLSNGAIGGSINVMQGSHTISTALQPASPVTFNVAGGATLTLGNLQDVNGRVMKHGPGKLVVNRVRATERLSITGGELEVQVNGGVSGISKVDNLFMAPNAKLDLTDNDLIVDNGAYTQIKTLVLAGFGDNPGITSSTSDGSQILALFDNALVSAPDWQGIPIGANAIVGKYTYFGDANIDGQVTGDDYTVIDANLNTTPATGLEWLSGDMNLDDQVTGDDYTVIDANLGLGVGNPLGASAAAVPEPGMLSLASLLVIGIGGRRRRGSGRVVS